MDLCETVKLFPSCQTAGHEVLAEMSLAELKERLALLRAEQQTEEEERRSHIQGEKQKKKKLLLERLDTIEFHRRALAKAAAIRSEECLALTRKYQKANMYHIKAHTYIIHIHDHFGMWQERGEEGQAGLPPAGGS